MIIVLSMHRSGSSLLSGLLHDNGISAGDESTLIPGNIHNPTGYFERSDVVEANNLLLKFDGYSSSLPNARSPLNLTESARERVKQVSEGLVQSNVGFIKDPRLCLTLPVWAENLSAVKVIFLYRHPFDVAESFVRRQGYPFNGGLALWEYYNVHAINNTVPFEHCIVGFDELISKPSSTLTRICEELNLTLPVPEVSTERFDLQHVHGVERSRSELHLTAAQSHLFDQVSSGELVPSMASETCLVAMDLMSEFMRAGYDPATGRVVDEKAAQDLAAAHANNRRLRNDHNYLSEKLRDTKVELSDSQGYAVELEKYAELLNGLLSESESIQSDVKAQYSRLSKSAFTRNLMRAARSIDRMLGEGNLAELEALLKSLPRIKARPTLND